MGKQRERATSGVGKSTGEELKLHIISAFVTEIGISLGQVAVRDEKSGEIELLDYTIKLFEWKNYR